MKLIFNEYIISISVGIFLLVGFDFDMEGDFFLSFLMEFGNQIWTFCVNNLADFLSNFQKFQTFWSLDSISPCHLLFVYHTMSAIY